MPAHPLLQRQERGDVHLLLQQDHHVADAGPLLHRLTGELTGLHTWTLQHGRLSGEAGEGHREVGGGSKTTSNVAKGDVGSF